jgi:hypothetical protein
MFSDDAQYGRSMEPNRVNSLRGKIVFYRERHIPVLPKAVIGFRVSGFSKSLDGNFEPILPIFRSAAKVRFQNFQAPGLFVLNLAVPYSK